MTLQHEDRRFPQFDLIQSTVQSSRTSIVQFSSSCSYSTYFPKGFGQEKHKMHFWRISVAAFLLHVQQVLDIVTYVTMWVVSVLCKKATPRVTLLRWFKPFSIQQKCIEMYRWMACIDMSPMNTFKHVTNRDDVTFSPLKLSLHWPYQI